MNKVSYKYILVSVLASGLMSIVVALILDNLQRKRDEANKQEIRESLNRGFSIAA